MDYVWNVAQYSCGCMDEQDEQFDSYFWWNCVKLQIDPTLYFLGIKKNLKSFVVDLDEFKYTKTSSRSDTAREDNCQRNIRTGRDLLICVAINRSFYEPHVKPETLQVMLLKRTTTVMFRSCSRWNRVNPRNTPRTHFLPIPKN